MRASPFPFPRRARRSGRRGSVLITALLIAVGIALAIGGYLRLSTTSLRLAHRSFLHSDALSVAEGGLEQALYCFNQMSGGAGVSTAWAGWTLSGSAAMRTFPALNRDQHAVAVLKVYVQGYNGGVASPYVIAQATLTPFDGGAPVVRTVRCTLRSGTGFLMNGLVALQGLTMKGRTEADSFHSNPTNSPTGPWRPYSTAIARSNTQAIVVSGPISIGSGGIKGNLWLGPTVTPPAASTVSGSIRRDFADTFRPPVYPTPDSVSQSYNLGSTLPATLPAAGHVAAADGNFYYFINGATIGALTVPTGRNIVLVGTGTRMTSGLTLQGNATCTIYIDGAVDITGTITNGSWAGALRIHTTTTADCVIGNSGQIAACLFAPNANFTAKGGNTSGMLVGSYLAKTITTAGQMDFHYDEALMGLSTEKTWQVTQWMELAAEGDRAALAALTGNFLN